MQRDLAGAVRKRSRRDSRAIQPGRQPGVLRRQTSPSLDPHSGLLFNAALPRTFRVRRDLRREALPQSALDLGAWQWMRSDAAADDRALWTFMLRANRELDEELRGLQNRLGEKARLHLRRRTNAGLCSYLFLGRRGVRTTNVDSAMLRAAGIRSLTLPIKRAGRHEDALRTKFDEIRRLSAAIDECWLSLHAVERRLARDTRQPLIFPPLVHRRVAALRAQRGRKEEVVGVYCPTPHIQFEGWRIRMLAYADALRTSVMTLNRLYNTHRRRNRSTFGRPRRVRFGLVSKLSESSWAVAPLRWQLILRARTDGNVIATSTVRGLTRVRHRSWRERGTSAPVAKPDGRLNPVAVALCHQPEMYPILQPFDAMAGFCNRAVAAVLAKAKPVLGARPSRHPHGGTARAAWQRTIKVRWWA